MLDTECLTFYKNQDKSKVVLKVQDSGIGISKESSQKLFQKFSQVEVNNPTGSVLGLGLGLYIVKEILKMHGGDVRAESEGEGKGSTFYVELPVNFIPPDELLTQKIEATTKL